MTPTPPSSRHRHHRPQQPRVPRPQHRVPGAGGGVRQFLDVGTGLPTVDNTHEVAQRLAPSRGSSTSTTTPWSSRTPAPCSPPARGGDRLRGPEPVRAGEDPGGGRPHPRPEPPTALILSGILGHVPDHGVARDLVRRLMAGLPSGSYLCVNDGSRAPTRPTRRPRTATTRRAPSPTSCGPSSRSRRTSRVWSWSSPASSRCRCGGRTRPGRPGTRADRPARRPRPQALTRPRHTEGPASHVLTGAFPHPPAAVKGEKTITRQDASRGALRAPAAARRCGTSRPRSAAPRPAS